MKNYLEHNDEVKYVDGLLENSQEWDWFIELVESNFDFEDIEFYSGVVGDFFLTNTMHKSRNFIYGTKRAISSNEGNVYIKKNTVEGYENIDNVVSFLNNKLKKYPILEAIHSILYKNEKTDILYNTCFKKD